MHFFFLRSGRRCFRLRFAEFNIFGSILRGRFTPDKFDQGVCDLAARLTEVSISLWNKIKAKMLPTPATFHYLFNMRDLSRVFQNVFTSANPQFLETSGQVVRLWRNECLRVYEDRLNDQNDKDFVSKQMEQIVNSVSLS